MDARDELMGLLKTAATRLRTRRALESAAVVASAGALAGAFLEAAALLASQSAAWASAACAASAFGAVAIVAWPSLRRRLALARFESVAICLMCVPAGLALAGVTILAGRGDFSLAGAATAAAWCGLALAPAGAIVGAFGAALRSSTPADTAALLDTRGRYRERLATAEEVSRSARATGPLARCLYAQALAAVADRPICQLNLWHRTRATAGALTLSVLLCGAMAIAGAARRGLSLAETVANLSASARQALAQRFQADARRVQPSDPALAGQYRQAARTVIELADQAQLQKVLAALRARGVKVRKVAAEAAAGARRIVVPTPPGHGASPAKPGGSTANGKNANGQGNTANGQGKNATGHGAASVTTRPKPPATAAGHPTTGPHAAAHQPGGAPAAPQGPVRVWNPAYALLHPPGRATGAPGAARHGGAHGNPLRGAAQATTMDYDQAWAAAQDRAAAALHKGHVPPRCRQLVRDFFAVGNDLQTRP